jgi:hypothetical protein
MAKVRPILSCWLSAMLAFMMPVLEGCNRSATAPSSTATSSSSTSQAPAATYSRPSADELYQLVAPIALFPDNLVAQVLAGSTYPDQIASAATWLKQNANLQGNDLTQAVNQESWDVSVKGLTQFPDVLNQMASNLSWTSALGDAFFNIPQDVMNSIQVMRQKASQAGNLQSGAQQTVTTEPGPAPQQQPQQPADQQPTVVQAPPQTIVIQPAQPDVVYVPSYNPTVVYGAPIAAYPGYVAPPPPSTGAVVATGLISFGLGMAVGAAMNNSCCGWGYNSWGAGWNNSTVSYNRNVYVSNSNTFVNRNNYYNRNVNNANINNINRNNYNANNVNRYNNNNYRANNFNNTARNSNVTTPNFGTQRNQAQYRNVNESSLAGASNRMNNAPENRQQLGQNANRQPVQPAGNRQQLGQNSNRQPVQQATGRQQLGQNSNRQPSGQAQGRPQTAQNQNRPTGNQAERGYGQQQRGTNSGAFNNYSQGGNARVNSARGQQSLSATPKGGNRQAGNRPTGNRGGKK